MDFLAHALAERGIDHLMALDAALAGELPADHERLEMLAVADHFDVLAGEPAFDSLLDAFRSDQWRFSFYVLSLYPDLSSKRQTDATAANAAATSARLMPGATSAAPKKP